MRTGRTVRVVPDADALAAEAAGEFRRAAAEAIAARGRFNVALSGGGTPLQTYAQLATGSGPGPAVSWPDIHWFWSDERMVPPTDARSNFGAVMEVLLRHVPVPTDRITRIRGESDTAAVAAMDYERALAEHLPLPAGGGTRFDFIFLGLGADGHTASLFPGAAELAERTRIAVPVVRAPPDVHRVSLSLPVLNQAARIVFLVSGEGKAAALARVLHESAANEASLPAARVNPGDGELLWLVDEAAWQHAD